MEGGGEARLDLADLGLAQGADVLLKHALVPLAPGARLAIFGREPSLAPHLVEWARARGHRFAAAEARDVLGAPAAASGARLVGWLERGTAATARWVGALQAGQTESDVAECAPPEWGLAARGATVEAGVPPFFFPLHDKDLVWADNLAHMYRQAAAAQWNPETAIPWQQAVEAPEVVEDALVQVLTYLIENETAALVIPARFASQVHPHYREAQQLLALQAADEARHIEVFTRRAFAFRPRLGLSTVGGQASLRTLIEEPDFELASLLLSVLGEGSFVNLLWFLHKFGPDACTRDMMKLAAQDEARHVAFGVAHLARHVQKDRKQLDRLAGAIRQRHAVLEHTAGLNEEVFEGLVILAAGSLEPAAIARGHAEVQTLSQQMNQGRIQRLEVLGFDRKAAEALSELHTRNFM
ncbi:MAG: ferritin-like domain-containing protein [Planctomycetota bacterium]